MYERKLEIIQNNVYGVDLDPFAVNIARLRLWLSLVVDFEPEEPGERVPPLPNLDFKIEQGDSLAAPTARQYHLSDSVVHHYERAKALYMRSHLGAKRVARAEVDRLRRDIAGWAHAGAPVDGFDWVVEFAEVFAEKPAVATLGGELNLGQELAANRPGGFDIVLANPPYVRMELFKDQKPTLRRNFPEVHSDRADLYIYFYGRALELLAPGGMLVFISSNKWFRAGYGKKLRKYIGERMRVESVTDFGDLPVFESASAYPMIFVAQKGESPKNAPGPLFAEPKSLDPPYPDVRAVVENAGVRLPASAVKGEDWRLVRSESAAVLAQMESTGISLRTYLAGEVLYGIKTGLNDAFIVSRRVRDQLVAMDPENSTAIKPFLTGRAIQRWTAEPGDLWILYMHHGINPSRYRAIVEYLRPYKERLEQRATKQAWYELQQPQQRYAGQFGATKIVFPDIAKSPRFARDSSGSFIGDTAFALISDDQYLLAVLNSAAVASFFVETGATIRGGYLRFKRQYVERIPIPRASPADREAIIDLAQKCVSAEGKGPGVAEWEAEIDERVAALYGLSGVPARADAE